LNNRYWKFSIIFATITVFSLLSSIPIIYAHTDTETSEINDYAYEPTTTVILLNNKIAIEKTILFFHSPEEPAYYWGYVEGKIANHVPGLSFKCLMRKKAFHVMVKLMLMRMVTTSTDSELKTCMMAN